MSDATPNFVPGLFGQTGQGDASARRGEKLADRFQPADRHSLGRRVEPVEPRHFSPADPKSNPTEGWDPFQAAKGSVGDGAEAPQGFVDPLVAARKSGYDAGYAAALEAARAAQEHEAALTEKIAATLASGSHFDRERTAKHLRQTLMHLLTKVMGEVSIAPDLLAARISAAVELLADTAEAALLRVHPTDLELIAGKFPVTVTAVADPSLAPGTFVIESATTIVEDGPDLWIDQLSAAIERVPIPPLC